MDSVKVNLGCGSTFVDGQGWINLDFTPMNYSVHQANLLDCLPFDDDSVNIIYSSHFIEHIPKSQVESFLLECFRIIQPGGSIRLVLPDFELLCREYLLRRDNGEHTKADLVVTEIVDQCVRLKEGGELLAIYEHVSVEVTDCRHMMEYINSLNGESFGCNRNIIKQPTEKSALSATLFRNVPKLFQRGYMRFHRAWFNWLINRLPYAFRLQNVSLAGVGERHHRLWGFHQLS